MKWTQRIIQDSGGFGGNGLTTMHRLVTFMLSISILSSSSHAIMTKVHISFRARLLQLHKRIELRQPALAENLFGESLCTLARAVAHRESLCGRQLKRLGETFCELLFGGSVKTCDGVEG